MNTIHVRPVAEMPLYAPLSTWQGFWDAFKHKVTLGRHKRLPYAVFAENLNFLLTHPSNVKAVCHELTLAGFVPVVSPIRPRLGLIQ